MAVITTTFIDHYLPDQLPLFVVFLRFEKANNEDILQFKAALIAFDEALLLR